MRQELAGRLESLRREGLERSLIHVDPSVVNLASNDYLGLSRHPQLARAAADAAGALGAGAGAARLVTGNLTLHEQLEQALAAQLGTERALLFGSGYLAHVGTIGALMDGADDVIYSDQLNHASIVDGCRLARARVRVYPHRDVQQLERLMDRDQGAGQRMVITESVFSMDGDEAPLGPICELCQRHHAWLMVDEAHAFGVRGPRGAGLAAELALAPRVQVLMGTLGKAAGSYGAFIAGSTELVHYLVNRARSFIYSTALPPSVAAASLAAVSIIGGEEGQRRREALQRACAGLRQGLQQQGWELGPVPGPILPLFVGDPHRAVALSEDLLRRGVLARAMRYPTVARGTERLRVVASSALDSNQLQRALQIFDDIKRSR